MNEQIQFKFETILQFQKNYPTSHIGGSIGLLIRGIDLKRDLSDSDIDITIDEFYLPPSDLVIERANSSDYDYSVTFHKESNYGLSVNMDIRISPEPSFEIVGFEGNKYNVFKLRDILFWKRKYAKREVIKHSDDLEVIRTGIRKTKPVCETVDDLPF